MDNLSTLKEEPLQELDITTVKEELLTNHEYEENVKSESSFDRADSFIKEESETSNNQVDCETIETSYDHKEKGEQDPVVGGGKKFLCDLCDFKASSEDEIRNHYLRSHAIGTSQRDKSATRSVVKKDKKYKCPHCDYRSYLTAHVKRHVMIHTGETPYGCPKCQFKTRDQSTLRRHIRTQHEKKSCDESTKKIGKLYVCRLCSYSTIDQRWMTRHEMASHDATKSRFSCQHCEFRCIQKSTFTNHVLLHNGIASHSCQLCDYKTNIPNELSKHFVRKHTDAKPLECTECNYRTSCRSDLSKHSIIHKNIRPYSCSLCDYKCKRSSHLMAHQSVHDKDVGKYTCPFCEYKTLNISCLKIHVRKHTGEKPYECDKCDAKYTSSAALKTHALSHLESWSQSCPICKFTSDKPRVFKSHVKTHDGTNKYRSQRDTKSPVSSTDEDVSSSE